MTGDLWNSLRRLLESEGGALLLEPPAELDPAEYDAIFRRVARRIRCESARIERARCAVEERYSDFEDLPAGRRLTVLQNSRAPMLLALSSDLMRRSYAARFDHVRRSLKLATLALEVVEYIGRSDYLTLPPLADLEAEALAYLGNARRVASDLPGAIEAFERAERMREAGTGDRLLGANLLSLRASLMNSQGLAEEAARLEDREIALRRLLGDPARLGVALISRGMTACWDEGPTERACSLIREGTELVDDYQPMLAGMLGLGEAFARAGKGADALLTLGTARMLVILVGLETFEVGYRWTEGLAFRALGDYTWAAQRLEEVCAALKEHGRARMAAVASTDLLAVYTAQGRYREASRLASEAWLTFQSEGLGHAGIAALGTLADALRKETATGALAVAVANYIAAYRHNRAARLVLPDPE